MTITKYIKIRIKWAKQLKNIRKNKIKIIISYHSVNNLQIAIQKIEKYKNISNKNNKFKTIKTIKILDNRMKMTI